MKRAMIYAAAALCTLASLCASAATHRFELLLDLDHNAATGCSATAGGATGIERIVAVTVNTTTTAATVSSIERRDCVSGSSFSAPQPLPGAPYGMNLGGAGGGANAIEFNLAMATLPTHPDPAQPTRIRLGATSLANGGATDALLPLASYQLRATTPNANGGHAVPVPLVSSAFIAIFALFIGAIAYRAITQQRKFARLAGLSHLFAGLLATALALSSAGVIYAIVLDGNIGDWSGSSALISDAQGDQPANADLVALHAKVEGSDLAIRIDAVIALETVVVGNVAPAISGLADQTIVAPQFAIAFAPQVSDDGLPAPANLTYQWQRVSGPEVVVFGNEPATPPDLSSAAAVLVAQSSALKDVAAFFDFDTPGVYVLRFTASDGALSTSRDVTVTVNPPLAVAPAIGPLPDRTIRLGETLSIALAGRDENTSDALTYSLPAAPSGAALTPNGSSRFTFTPSDAQIGNHPVTIRVSDSASNTAQASFTISVVAANRPPKFTSASYADASSRVGAAFARTLAAVDPDSPETLHYSLVDGPAGMTVATSGALAWTPNNAQRGSHVAKIQAIDSAGNREVKMFAVNIASNTPPIARSDTYRVTVGATLTVPAATGVLANDVDPDGDAKSAAKLTDPSKGALTNFNADGSFSYTAPNVPVAAPFAVKKKFTLPRNGLSWNGFNSADINGDGKPDILISMQGGYAAYSGADGSELWARGSEPGDFFGHSAQGTVLTDTDDDGELEFIAYHNPAAGSQGIPAAQGLFAMNARTGVTLWRGPSLTPVIDGVLGGARPVVGALERNGITVARLYADQKPKFLLRRSIAQSEGAYQRPDLSFAPTLGCMGLTGLDADRGTACRATFIVDHLGVTEAVLTAPNPSNDSASYANGFSSNRVIAADLDGDGAPEIISGGDVYKRVNGSWQLQWTTPWQPQNVAVADLDGDGKLEVIHSYQWPANFGGGRPEGIFIYTADGAVVRRLNAGPLSIGGYMSVTDLDGDGSPEIMVYNYGVVQVFRADGRRLWTYVAPNGNTTVPPLTDPPPLGVGRDARMDNPSTGYGSRNNIVAYDLDGDGIKEVVFWSNAGTVFLNGKTGAMKAIYGLSGGQIFANQTYDQVAIVDTDNDGRADVVTVSSCPYFLFITEYGFCDGQYTVLSAVNNDWQPGPKIWSQMEYIAGQIEDNGYVNYNPSVGSNYRTPPQLGTPRDPRAFTSTVFTYQASDGAVNSSATDVYIEIAPQNSPPVFTSVPPTAHFSDLAAGFPRLAYTARAVDPDVGDTVRYELVYSSVYTPWYPQTTVDPATGEVQIFTGPCPGGLTCNLGNILTVIAAVDSFGARTEQTFFVDVSPVVATVPNVVGMQLETARASLESATLTSNVIDEVYSAAPTGEVLNQFPLAGAAKISRNATVSLTVSKGPVPVIVPNVVGSAESLAKSKLEALGFTVNITRQFSTEPRGSVVSQSINAGETVVAGSITLIVSSGSGLSLRLSTSAVIAGQSLTLIPEVTDANGNPSAVPSLTYSVAPVSTHLGALPTASGNAVTTSSDTLGAFIVTANDSANSRSAAATFVVTLPIPATGRSSGATLAKMMLALESMEALAPAMRAARAANDTAQMNALLTQYVTTWRTVNVAQLKLTTPITLPQGFAPTEEMMIGFGLSPQPNDFLIQQTLREASEDLQAWTAGLRAQNTSLIDLRDHADQFATRAARINSLTLSEYGGAMNNPEIIAILTRDIPEFYEALTDELAVVVGLPRRDVRYPNFKRADAKSTLAEVLVTEAVDMMVDKIMEQAAQTYKNAKKFATDTMAFAAYAAAATAAFGHLKDFAYGNDMVEIVSGASLSIRLFESPYTFIEVHSKTRRKDMFTVMVMGPDLFTDAFAGGKDFVEKLKTVLSYGRDAVTNPDRVKNADDLFTIRDQFQEKLDALIETGSNTIKKATKQFYQSPGELDTSCVFTTAPCRQLLYGDGFESVYSYQPPPGFEALSGIPVPIIFIVVDNVTGDAHFGLKLFFPTLPAP